MLRKEYKESNLDFKKRMLDPVSQSFCGAKWYNVSLYLHIGQNASCHLPPSHEIPINLIKNKAAAIHNTPWKKEQRRMMLTGVRPPECEYCWKIEDLGPNSVSDRVFKSIIYTDEDLQKAAATPYSDDVAPKTVEVVFDRTCNFACSYCAPEFSTSWTKDIKKNGPYQNLIAREGRIYENDGRNQDHLIGNNPYIDAFWEYWPEMVKELEELRVTGGEPLMSTDVWKIIDLFAEQKYSAKLAINSNLGAKPDLIEKLIDYSYKIPSLSLYTSMEAMGAQAEYIRDGLIFDEWVANCEALLERGNLRDFNVMCTVTSICLWSLTDLLDKTMEWKRKYGRQKGVFTLNILRWPAWMSPLVLPNHIKDSRREELERWLEKNKNDPMLHDIERDNLTRLIDYLNYVKTPYTGVVEQEDLWKDMKSFYTQYDQRRGKNFNDTFPPELVEWFKTL
jgi:organic radical activating enzyme